MYIDRTMTANSFMFRGICPTEVYDEIMSLKVNKSALYIPRKCIKHTASHVYEASSMVFNQSLLQGIFSENIKLSKVTAIDKGDEQWILVIIDASLHSTHKRKFSKNMICKHLLNYLEKHEIL